MHAYTETQQNKYRWYLISLFIAVEVGFLISFFTRFSFLAKEVPQLFLGPVLFFFIMTGLCYLTFFKQISLRLDEGGVHFQVPFSWSGWQHIPWPEIERLYVREYALFGEYPKGLLGFQQGPNGFAYAPQHGSFGLQVEKKSGGKVLLGTHQPGTLKQFLLNRKAANPVFPA